MRYNRFVRYRKIGVWDGKTERILAQAVQESAASVNRRGVFVDYDQPMR